MSSWADHLSTFEQAAAPQPQPESLPALLGRLGFWRAGIYSRDEPARGIVDYRYYRAAAAVQLQVLIERGQEAGSRLLVQLNHGQLTELQFTTRLEAEFSLNHLVNIAHEQLPAPHTPAGRISSGGRQYC